MKKNTAAAPLIVPQDMLRREVRKVENRFEILRTALSILIALVIVLVIIALISKQPLVDIKQMLVGPLGSTQRFANVIQLMIPLTFCGLAITMVFKTNRFNLASDSAFFMGLMIAVLVAVYSTLPPIITIALAMLAGFITGALIGFIPAILAHKFGANELVVSLMLNYIIGFAVMYLFNYVVRDPYSANMQSKPIPKNYQLTSLIPKTNVHTGIFVMLVAVLVCYLVLYKTRWGYALRMTGANARFAHYAGIKVSAVVLLTQALGTGLAGLGGAVEMLGAYRTFKWQASPLYGFDGVILATLAHSNPAAVPFAAFFLAYVRVGADILNRTSDIPAEIVSVVQATIILLIAAKAFLSRWKQRTIVKKAEEIDQMYSAELAVKEE